MLKLTDTQWAALLDGACPPFQGLNSLERDCEEAGKIYPNTVCAECWEKWLETTKEAE